MASLPTMQILRTIRSYVRREGRMTDRQKRALENFWPRYGLSLDQRVIDLACVFGRDKPCVLEIGFGMGESLLAQAQENPDTNFIGIEVFRIGVGALLASCAESGVENIRIFNADAVEVLRQCIPDHSLDRVQLFFPDPWPKKRHHKRRLVQPDFASLVAQKLKPDGIFHMATDWENYAEHMMAVLESSSEFRNLAGPNQFSPRPSTRSLTKFETRGLRLGHGVWDLLYVRKTHPR